MKIAIFSENFYPELSGISDSILSLGKELAKEGHKVKFYVPRYSKRDYERIKVPYKELELDENIEIYRSSSLSFPGPTQQARAVIPSPLRWWDVKKFKPDIIHTQLFFGLGLDAIISGKINRIPIVGTNHTAISEFIRYSPIRTEWLKKFALRYVAWYYNQCEYVTAPSQSVFNEMGIYGFSRPYLKVSNPVETSLFKPVESKIKKDDLKIKLGLSPHTMVFAGRLSLEKNIGTIIKCIPHIIKVIPDLTFAIAGHGVIKQDLKRQVDELGLSNHVKFVGSLSKAKLSELYQASEIFVIMSTSETQSMVMMQAMACGLPIVGVRSRGLSEYINDKNGVMVEPEDYLDFTKEVVSLFQDENKINLLGRGGVEFVQQFSPIKITEEWINIYKQLLSG